MKSLPLYLVGFVVLFVTSGIGNGSTYKMIPAIFAAKGQKEVGSGGEVSTENGANIGTLRVRHSVTGADIYTDGRLGSVSISGDLIESRIIARGLETPANAALGVALQNVRVSGSVVDSFIATSSQIPSGWYGRTGRPPSLATNNPDAASA